MNVAFEKDRSCDACQAGKQVGAHHHAKNIMKTTRPLEILCMDLFGPVAYISIDGNKYGLIIVDDYSRFTWVFVLQDKSETQEVLKKFLRRAQNEFDAKVKKIRSDNGTEFKNTQVEDFLDEEGIKHEFLVSYTPQQNGVAEMKNRTLIEMVRTMLNEYKTSYEFLKKTSYELLTGNKFNISYFLVFESKCYILQKRPKSSKFAPKTYEGVLLGYDSYFRAYRVFNVTTGCIKTTYDAVFDETNGSQKEQVDLYLIDDEQALCDAL
jgi:transposase InsO family protein